MHTENEKKNGKMKTRNSKHSHTYTHTQNLCENLRCTDRKDDSNPNWMK